MEEYRICFEDYEISNFGNVRKKLKNGEYKIIRGSIQNRGYYYFQVQRNKKRINLLFHHLVAETFIGPRPQGLVIDHIDRNKLNNNVNNLRYVTQEDNCRNHERYRDDIEETDKHQRRLIFQKEYDLKRGHNRNLRRSRGSGQIIENPNGRFKFIITINKIKTNKTFDTLEDIKIFINTLKANNTEH